jgi:hypothetical protein
MMDSIKYDKVSWSCLNPVTKAHSNGSVIIILMMFYFQSTNTIIILKSNEHKSYAWVFSVICTFQSSKFLQLKKKILKLTAFIKPDGIHIQA